jgi:hypothetical protein
MQLFHGVGSLESLQETSTIERGAFLLFQLHHASNSGNVVTWAWVKGYGIRQILKLAALQILIMLIIYMPVLTPKKTSCLSLGHPLLTHRLALKTQHYSSWPSRGDNHPNHR